MLRTIFQILLILGLIALQSLWFRSWWFRWRKEPSQKLKCRSIRSWASYRLSYPIIGTLLLVIYAIPIFLFGFFLSFGERVPDIGAALRSIHNKGIFWSVFFRSICSGTFFDGLCSGIETIVNLLEGESQALRNGFPNLHATTTFLSLAFPTLAISTLIASLLKFFPKYFHGAHKEYLIFSQAEERGILLAESMMEDKNKRKNRKVIFLHTEVEKLSPEVHSRLKALGTRIYPYSEADLLRIHPRLQKRILRFFFLSPNEEDSFNDLNTLIDQIKEQGLFSPPTRKDVLEDMEKQERKGIYRQEFYFLSESTSSALMVDRLRDKMCDTQDNRIAPFTHTDLHLLDRYRIINYDLLCRNPLYETAHNDDVRVLILGFGKVGQSFLRSAASFAAMDQYNFSFSVLDLKEKEHARQLLAEAPEVGRDLDGSIHKCNLESEKLEKVIENSFKCQKPFTYIMLSLGEDDRNIRVLRNLVRIYRKLHWEKTTMPLPAIFVNLENTAKAEYVPEIFNDPKVPLKTEVIGGDKTTFSEEMLLNRRLWEAAKTLHETLKKDKISGDYFMTEYDRRSSIASVSYSKYLLQDMKEKYTELSGIDFSTDIPKLKEMAKIEHNRWMRFSRSEGMRYISTKEALSIFGARKKHRDEIGGLTPCLVPFEKLQEVYNDLYENKKNPPAPFGQQDACVVMNVSALHRFLYDGLDELSLTALNQVPNIWDETPSKAPPVAVGSAVGREQTIPASQSSLAEDYEGTEGHGILEEFLPHPTDSEASTENP